MTRAFWKTEKILAVSAMLIKQDRVLLIAFYFMLTSTFAMREKSKNAKREL